MIEAVTSPRGPPRKKSPTSPRGASFSDTQRALRLHATAIITKEKEFVKEVRKAIKPNRTPRAASEDVRRLFEEQLYPYIVAGVRWKD